MAAAVQFALVPNFGQLAFSDDAPIGEALYHVLKARQREEPVAELSDKVSKQMGVTTVGGLRQFTDHDWKNLQLPAIARIYLKYVVRQSLRKEAGHKSFMDLLQDDFNFGQPFDMSLYQTHLSMLASMGFSTEEGMEALLITENKGIEGALEILFQEDKSVRDQRRVEAVQRLGRRLPASQPAPSADQSVALVRQQLETERQQKERLQIDLRAERAAARLNAYKFFIKGALAGGNTNSVAMEKILDIRKERKITDLEHQESIKSLGLSMEQFDALKNGEHKAKGDLECVVCLDKPKDHLIMNCMHLCLCEGCAVNYDPDKAKNASCPICSKKVKKVVRVYSS